MSAHPVGDLPAYTNGTLAPPQDARVQAHLATCAQCRAELGAWQALAEAARRPAPVTAEDAETSRAVLHRAWSEIARRRERGYGGGRPATVRGASLLWQLARAQVRVVPVAVWSLSALAVAVGFLLSVVIPTAGDAGSVLGLIVCATGGVGAAIACGLEGEPCPELCLSLPVSPRAVLALRLGVVFLFDALLGLGGSAGVAAAHSAPSLWSVSGLWLGPLLALGALSAALAAIWGSVAAASGALAVWAVRLFGGSVIAAAWHTSAPVLALAALLVGVALAWRPRLPRPA